jgi:ribonuclease P protein component
MRNGWLRKHADYQRVYREGVRRSAPLLTYFFAQQPSPHSSSDSADAPAPPARVGLTAGRVLGNAVARNRIKRRMRAAVAQHRKELPPGIDLVLHPRATVRDVPFAEIERDLLRVFRAVPSSENFAAEAAKTPPRPAHAGRKPRAKAGAPAAPARQSTDGRPHR